MRYALGEFGAFTLALAGRSFYPIMVAEKQVCWTRARCAAPRATARCRSAAARWACSAAARAPRRPAPAGARDDGGARDDRGDRGRAAAGARAAAARPARAEHHRRGCSRAGRARAHVRPAAAQHGEPDGGGGRGEDQRDPRRGHARARLPPAAGLRPRGALRRAARARRHRDGARGDTPRPGRSRAGHGHVRAARGHAARARPQGAPGAAAAAGA